MTSINCHLIPISNFLQRQRPYSINYGDRLFMHAIKSWLLLFLVLAFTFSIPISPALCATFYVSPNGSNAANGSEHLPWQTIQYALDTLSSGDTVIVKPGLYKEMIRTRKSGDRQNRIAIKAEKGVTLHGGFKINHAYITIRGFEITGTGGNAVNIGLDGDHVHILQNDIHDFGKHRAIFIKKTPGVSVHPTGVTIKGNRIHGKLTAQVYISLGGSDCLVEGNEIGPGKVVEDCFRPFGDNHIIRNNYVHDVTSGGGHTDVFQIFNDHGWRVRNLIFDKNTVINWQGQAWMVDATPDSTDIMIRNNIFVNIPEAGQSFCPRPRIFNNVFVKTGYKNCQSIMIRSNNRGRGTGAHSEVKNNIFYETGCHNKNGWYSVNKGARATFEGDYNLVYPYKRRFPERNGINGDDPKFRDVSKNDFSLKARSAAIDAGVRIPDFDDDKNSVKRPLGRKWDIGAYEYAK